MAGITSIGLSGLMAYKNALTVTSNNIANANTPYYSRQITEFGQLGAMDGVTVMDVQRISDESANRYLQAATSNFSNLDAYLKKMQDFESLFDDNTTSINKYISNSLSTLEGLNLNAGGAENRSLYFSSLNALASRFQDVNNEINRQSQVVNQALQDSSIEINNLLSGIANLNKQITASNGKDVGGFLDQRDGMIQSLATYMNFTTYTDSSNIISVNLSNGMSIVSGNHAAVISTIGNPENLNQLMIAVNNNFSNPNAAPISITHLIQGGSFAGLINFRDHVLNDSQNALGRLSMAISQSLNAQNKLGIDLNGNQGRNIFLDINSAEEMGSRVKANTNNSGYGSFTVSVDDINQLTASDYKFVLGASNAYTITRLSDNAIVDSGTVSSTLPQAVSVDGFTMNINSQNFQQGDVYIISPTKNAVDNMTMSITNPFQLALGWPVSVSNGVQSPESTGKLFVTAITDASNASFSTPKQLSPPIKVVFTSATTYNIVNATTQAVIESAIPYNVVNGGDVFPTSANYDPGYRIRISGSPQTGDTFNIDFPVNAAGDNRNGLAMAQLYQNRILNNGTQTFDQAFLSINSDVSTKVNIAQSGYDVASVLQDQAIARQDEISGVSLEEETMTLSRFQQAYEASAQILQTAKAIMDIIISMVRR